MSRPEEHRAAALFTSITGIRLVHVDGDIDFWSVDGSVAVEVMMLTSESYREALSQVRDSSRLQYRWEFFVPVNRLGEVGQRAPSLKRIMPDLEEALVGCERQGITEPTTIEPIEYTADGFVLPQPQATVCDLLGGQFPDVMSLCLTPDGDISPGISISPSYGGSASDDPDCFAAELNRLVSSHRQLGGHVAKTQRADASRRVLVLLTDSTWGLAWDFGSEQMGAGALPTVHLAIDDQTPFELWIVGGGEMVWAYAHPSGRWSRPTRRGR